MDNFNLEVVNEAKLLGKHITKGVKWDLNTQHLVSKRNSGLQLLRKTRPR